MVTEAYHRQPTDPPQLSPMASGATMMPAAAPAVSIIL